MGSDVKRFSMAWGTPDGTSFGHFMSEAAHGDYVLHADYATLSAELERERRLHHQWRDDYTVLNIDLMATTTDRNAATKRAEATEARLRGLLERALPCVRACAGGTDVATRLVADIEKELGDK